MTTQHTEKGGATAPPFYVDDPVRLKTGYTIGKVIRVSNVAHAPYLVQWHDKAKTTGWYAVDELRDAW